MTDDDSIEVGDFVLVPVGKDNHEAIVEVVNIECFNEENVPLRIEKTKKLSANVAMKNLTCQRQFLRDLKEPQSASSEVLKFIAEN